MKKNDILILLIPSFVFVLAWIGFSIVHNLSTPTISESINRQITPITPNFDTKTISDIKSRQIIEPIYEIATLSASLSSSQSSSFSAALENNLLINQTVQPTPTTIPTPTVVEPTPTTDTSLPQ